MIWYTVLIMFIGAQIFLTIILCYWILKLKKNPDGMYRYVADLGPLISPTLAKQILQYKLWILF